MAFPTSLLLRRRVMPRPFKQVTFDAGSQNTTFITGSGTLSWSHTNSGSLLLVAVWGNASGASSGISAVTYNGVAMTLLATTGNNGGANAARYVTVWYLVGPPTGTHTIAATSTADHAGGMAVSYLNAAAPEASSTTSQGTGSSTFSMSVTTLTPNAVAILAIKTFGGTPSAGANTTGRQIWAAGSTAIFDTGTAEPATGSYTLNAATTSSGSWNGIVLSIPPNG